MLVLLGFEILHSVRDDLPQAAWRWTCVIIVSLYLIDYGLACLSRGNRGMADFLTGVRSHKSTK